MIAASTNPSGTTKAAIKPANVQQQKSIFINFVAGGLGGTAGVFVTCPLDVIQTRLQSSHITISAVKKNVMLAGAQNNATNMASVLTNARYGTKVFQYMRHIAKSEGIFGLYRGMIPNLVGIAPSRAIYFAVYTKVKSILVSTHLANSSWTHMLSALSASFSVSTLTDPIWFMKTRLQLDTNRNRKPVLEVIREVLRKEGIRGFYRGLSASYIGASETMIYFVLYEHFKFLLDKRKHGRLNAIDIISASLCAKMVATISVYPHEVVRTRLRQEAQIAYENRKYKGFLQTLTKVFREERWRGMYGGMGAHLMRQVPNTVIMFVTYETVVNFFS